MQNKKNEGHEIKPIVPDMGAKWAIFVLKRVRVWDLGSLGTTSTQTLLESPSSPPPTPSAPLRDSQVGF